MPSLSGLLILDKPRGWTSHDAVAWLRRRVKTRQVGHAGTLDPAAEGVLVVAVGSATRLLPYLQEADKQYVAHVVLGIETTTDDLEGEITAITEATPPSQADVEATLQRFQGEIVQVPPRFSAIKVDGTPLYRRARAGQDVSAPPRRVTISRLSLLWYHYPDLVFVVDCSKGTYVRSLARDIGAALGTGGYLHGLVRTRVGRFTLAQAWTIDELEAGLSPETWSLFALPPEDALSAGPALILSEQDEAAWYHGSPVRLSAPAVPDLLARVYTHDGYWAGLARPASTGRWRPVLVTGQ